MGVGPALLWCVEGGAAGWLGGWGGSPLPLTKQEGWCHCGHCRALAPILRAHRGEAGGWGEDGVVGRQRQWRPWRTATATAAATESAVAAAGALPDGEGGCLPGSGGHACSCRLPSLVPAHVPLPPVVVVVNPACRQSGWLRALSLTRPRCPGCTSRSSSDRVSDSLIGFCYSGPCSRYMHIWPVSEEGQKISQDTDCSRIATVLVSRVDDWQTVPRPP